MAKKQETGTETGPPQFSEADQARAREWFAKAGTLREKQNYDYAIESFIRGLEYWPEAVEEGHMPLRSLAIQRAQAGGKKPGMMENMRKSMTGKDHRKAMLNAEELWAKDPTNTGYADGVVRNAAKGGFLHAAQWAAPLVLETLKKEKKPNKARFKTFRELMVQAARQADEWDEAALEVFFLEQAVQSLEFAIVRMPTESELKDEQRDLAGKLTIARGKYEDAGDFRESLQDAEAQKLLHDAERGKQADETLEAVIGSARQRYQEAPDVSANLNKFIDALTKSEEKRHEDEAIDVLMKEFERTKNYNYKQRADDVRLRQLTRSARNLVKRAKQTGKDEDRQQARLAAIEQRQAALDIYRERVVKYPTDLRLKARLGAALFEASEYDEAIPVLQEAQGDPRHRARCQLLIGRSFYQKEAYGQAAAVLAESLDKYELTDEHSKQLMYWLARAYEADQQEDAAKDMYGKLLRVDYNYMDGDARRRLDELTQKGKQEQK